MFKNASAIVAAGAMLVLPPIAASTTPSGDPDPSTVTAAKESGSASRFTAGDLIGTTIWASEAYPGWVTGYGSVIDFVADGTGVSYEGLSFYNDIGDPATFAKPFTWSITDSVLQVNYTNYSSTSFPYISYPYDELAQNYGFDQTVVDFMNLAFENSQFVDAQVEITTHTISRTSSIDSQAAGRAQVSAVRQIEYSMDDTLTTLGWTDPLPRGSEIFNDEFLVYLAGTFSNSLQTPPAAGDTWAVPHLYRPQDPRVPGQSQLGWFIDLLTLNGTGDTSVGPLSQDSFAWSATADGLVLDAGNERYTYTPIETDGYVYFALVTYTVNGDTQVRSAQWIVRGDGTGATLAADLAQPETPFYWQAGINIDRVSAWDEDGLLFPPEVFGYSLADDGTSFRIYGSYVEDCLADENEACYWAEGGPLWTWTANGDTIVRDREQNPDFSRSREWTVLSYQPGGRAVVFEWAVWQYLPDPWEFYIPPRINTLEVMNLSAQPEEWADAFGFYSDDDGDGDGIADAADNCLDHATTDLRDGDGDGIGTACDPDHNQDCAVNFGDLALFYQNFLGSDEAYDYSGDGHVNFVDFARMKQLFFSGTTPGPGASGVPNPCN